ncbi:MAG TPA: metal ABC transporter permease [Candidatus Gracilibacteria bacterium]|nr:metal ABC transporter permease [Candidatus Gracilibacteria bacterium]
MVRSFIAGLIIAIIAPIIGSFLVIRRFSLLSDTLAHVSLVGVAVGFLANINPLITATAVSILAALGMEKLRTQNKTLGETSLALFLSGSLAIATVLIGLAKGFNTNLLSYLFGSIATISLEDTVYMAVAGAVALVIIIIFYKEFLLVSFDEELATAQGLNARLFNNLIVIIAAIVIAVAMRIVGILLVGALMVIPVITATRLGRSFKGTLLISIGLSVFAVITGLFVSFYLDLASGGTIVVISLLLFMASLLYKPRVRLLTSNKGI